MNATDGCLIDSDAISMAQTLVSLMSDVELEVGELS